MENQYAELHLHLCSNRGICLYISLKKDQCETCVEQAAGNLTGGEWNQHRLRKDGGEEEEKELASILLNKKSVI